MNNMRITIFERTGIRFWKNRSFRFPSTKRQYKQYSKNMRFLNKGVFAFRMKLVFFPRQSVGFYETYFQISQLRKGKLIFFIHLFSRVKHKYFSRNNLVEKISIPRSFSGRFFFPIRNYELNAKSFKTTISKSIN